jgi:hypothetical protein
MVLPCAVDRKGSQGIQEINLVTWCFSQNGAAVVLNTQLNF